MKLFQTLNLVEAGKTKSGPDPLEYQTSCSSRIRSFLCFGGLLRLSGITRVAAGANPDFLATRRASVPLSSFFLRRFISSLLRNDFLYGAVSLIDRFIRIRKRAGIGIRDVNVSKRLPCNFVRRLARRPDRIVQGVVFVGVAVGPAIHRDGLDVSGSIKAAASQNACQLI